MADVPGHSRHSVWLGSVALMLGLLAFVAGERPRNERVSLNPGELASMIQNELDHVTAEELASWIREGKPHMRVIDLRNPEDYAAEHIPGAENWELTKLVDVQFDRNQTIVLYSEGGIHAAQAMFLLWARGHKTVYTLKGGMASWKDFLGPAPLSARPSHRAGASRPAPGVVKRDVPEETRQDSLAGKRVRELPEREKSRDEC